MEQILRQLIYGKYPVIYRVSSLQLRGCAQNNYIWKKIQIHFPKHDFWVSMVNHPSSQSRTFGNILVPMTWGCLMPCPMDYSEARWRAKFVMQILPCPKSIWLFPKIVVPQNGWFIMENPIKMDDLGVPLFSETSIWSKCHCKKASSPVLLMNVSRRYSIVDVPWWTSFCVASHEVTHSAVHQVSSLSFYQEDWILMLFVERSWAGLAEHYCIFFFKELPWYQDITRFWSVCQQDFT